VKRVNIAVVGCGFIAETAHIPNLLMIPKARLVALCDVDRVRLNAMGAKFNSKNLFVDFREIVENAEVDAVMVCTPTVTHAEIAEVAVKAGKHVFVEKPLATSYLQGKAVVEAAEKGGCKLMVGYQMRFLPNQKKVKEMVHGGEIGEPFYAEAHGETLIIKPKDGILLDYGTHLIDVLRWHFDDSHVEKVAALTRATDNKYTAETEATLILKFANGVIGQIGVFWFSNYKSWEAAERYIKVLGTKGKVITDLNGPTITLYKEGSLISKVKGPHKIMPKFAMNPHVPLTEIAYRRELEHFIDSIIKDRSPNISGRQDLVTLKIVEIAKQSSKDGSFVEVGIS
jgi:predicted dehydrogenase